MKELLLYIARSLVDHPDQVTVTEVENGDELTLELRVAPEDMGKVIGRQGRIAKEIRTVVRSYAQRTGVKASVDIVDCPPDTTAMAKKTGQACACPVFYAFSSSFRKMGRSSRAVT